MSPVLSLPPEDRGLSPYTGWTRGHWEAVCDGLVGAVRAHASPGHGLVPLPGGRPSVSGVRSDGLEGFARTLLAAAWRVAGAGGRDPWGHLEWYARGLESGTRRPTAVRGWTGGDRESWPLVGEVRQARVESASVALALRVTRPWLWERLPQGVRERVVAWLLPSLGPSPVDNNWWLFGLTVGGFLREVGVETERADRAVDRGLERIEEWYRGGGWYSDGDNRAFDHYNGWALHFYPVLHAHLSGDAALLERYGARLRAHLEGFTRLFGTEGSPLVFGRSLTYRFATVAAPWLGALTGYGPLSAGATRRLASGVLRHFVDHGAPDGRGLLSLGWHGPHPPMVQGYSGPASPYWASKGLLGLLAPAGHPVWTEVEEPQPSEGADRVTALAAPGWLAQSTAVDGLVRLHNHGSVSVSPPPDPYYGRFAYSTATGPTSEGPAVEGLADNHFALWHRGAWTVRGPLEPLGVGAGWAASAHVPLGGDGRELSGTRVVSVTLARGRVEVRAHRVVGAEPGTGVRQTGWAAGPGLTSALLPGPGYRDGVGWRVGGATPLAGRPLVPLVRGRVGDRAGALFVAAASLTAEPDPEPLRHLVQLGLDQGVLEVRWADGAVWWLRWEEDLPRVEAG